MWCICILRGAGGSGKERRCGITYGAQRRSVADLLGVLAVLWMVEEVCDDVERGAAGFAVVARDDVPHYLCVLQVVAVNYLCVLQVVAVCVAGCCSVCCRLLQ